MRCAGATSPTDAPRFGVLKLGTGNSVAALVSASSLSADGILDDVLRARAGEVPGYRTIDCCSSKASGRRSPGWACDGKLLNDYIWVKQNFGQGPLSRLMTGAGGYFTSVALKTVPYYLTHSTAVDCEVVNGRRRRGAWAPTASRWETFAPGAMLYQGPLMMAAAGTVPFYGFELKMFPFAGKRRGLMDLRIGTLPAATIIANLPKLWAGNWFPEGLKDFLVNDATIRFSREMPFQIAGDAAGYRKEVRFEVAPEPIHVVDFKGAVH